MRSLNLGKTINATSGFASVSNLGSGITVNMNNVSFDPSATRSVEINEILVCDN